MNHRVKRHKRRREEQRMSAKAREEEKERHQRGQGIEAEMLTEVFERWVLFHQYRKGRYVRRQRSVALRETTLAVITVGS